MTLINGIIFGVLLTSALATLLLLVLRRMKTSGFVFWARLVSRVGMVVATVLTTIKIIGCFIPNGLVQAQISTNQSFWPTPPNIFRYHSNATAHVAVGGFQHADVYVANAGWGAKSALGLSALAMGLLVIAVCVAAHLIATAVGKGASFSDVSGKWIRRVAWIVGIGGEVAAIASAVGNALVAKDLLGTTSGYRSLDNIPNPWQTGPEGNLTTIYGLVQPVAGMSINLELWPVLTGLGLYLLARIIDQGKVLQDETDGLV